MVEAVQEILHYVSGQDRDSIRTNRPLQHLVLRNLEILGEAASRVSMPFRNKYPEIPWREMIDLRNRLVHVYFDLDLNVVWKTVQQDLPEVLPPLEAILEQEE